jgi:hypothetical protein
MSDYRDPNDPWRGSFYEPTTGNLDLGWGWIAAAVLAVIVVVIVLTIGRGPVQTASNQTSPPTASGIGPPPAVTPRPMTPANRGLMPPRTSPNAPPK